ncbi:quinone-dependent dihydroorotate dehydrogenase [Brevibacillus daliensis]|uniref:quinone-dependent dihydroorotate dehydrogenase n=1 Tax=Brevibacillus daliensis TaxID=2892995 RepID=UPI001E4803C7|nr:quinone-dependent dihydroorotate dehydrogenase [Brevibacillus daliensis]
MYKHLKKWVFKMDPEKAHENAIMGLKLADSVPLGNKVLDSLYGYKNPHLANKVWDIVFPNPVGLAAGFDKNAEVYRPLAHVGFGHVEVGTITPLAQPGNDKPRLFRLVEDDAIINRMGFNNSGTQIVAKNLAHYQDTAMPVGINIGKNKLTPNEKAASDYEKCLEALYPYGHYFGINVSSPNTPNLRDLQQVDSLRHLLRTIRQKADELEKNGAKRKPILLKVAPDMSDEQMKDVVQVALEEGMDGLIATNTTLSREHVTNRQLAEQTGGLSGPMLFPRALEVVRDIYQEVGDKLPIIGVGGIFTGDDAYRMMRAGASMVQIYTSMIYIGPGAPGEINARLYQLMKQDGFDKVSQIIGADR